MARTKQTGSGATRWARGIRRGFVMLLTLVLLLLALLGLVQLPPVRARLANALSRQLNHEALQVHIGTVQGLVPFDVSVNEITLSDGAGVWLNLQFLRARLSFTELVKGRLVFQELSAASVALHRKPTARAESPKKHTPFPWPPRGPDIEVVRLDVGRLALEAAFAGERIVLRVRGGGRMGPKAGLRLSLQARRTDALPGQARLELSAESSTAVVQLEGELRDDPKGPLARRLGVEAEGPLHIRLRGEGPPGSWKGHLTVTAPGLGRGEAEVLVDARPPFGVTMDATLTEVRALDAHGVEQLSIQGRLLNLQTVPEGHVQLRAILPARAWRAQSDVRVESGSLRLSHLEADAEGVSARGHMMWHMADGLAEGVLKLKAPYLDVPAARWGWAVGGQADATVEWTAAGGSLDLNVQGRLLDATTPGWEAKVIEIQAKLKDVVRRPSGQLRLSAEHIHARAGSVSNLVLEAAGDGRRVAWEVGLAGGDLQGPYGVKDAEADVQGTWQQIGASNRWQFLAATGRVGRFSIRLTEPASLMLESNRWTLSRLSAACDQGRLTGSAAVGKDQVNLQAEIQDVPLGLFAGLGVPFLKGHAGGRLAITGPPHRPTAEADVLMTGVTPRPPWLIPLKPAQVHWTSRADPARWESTLSVDGLSDQPLTGNFVVPLTWSLVPFRWAIAPDAPLSGRVQGAASLGAFLPADGLDEQILQGQCDVELRAGGTWARPDVAGHATLSEGRYENLRSGTLLDEISIAAEGNLSRLTITRAKATDGEGGRYSLTGHMDLDPAARFPFHFDLQAEDTALVRQDAFSLTADGQLTLSGDLADSLLSGKLQAREAEYNIPNRLPPEIVELNVVELNNPSPARAPAPGKRADSAAPLRLDLDLRAPARVFVRGRGLDSEWRAALRIGGTLSAPTYAGTLDVLRGRFMFLGRRFTLGRGSITLDGSERMEPLLNLVAESSVSELNATLTLTGSLEAPELTLTSEPPLPSDEIIAYLLFGRSADLITPLQALRLAYGLEILRGGDTTFDVLGKGQSLLRVDQLELKQDEDQPELSAIAVGKYLGDRVYVQGEKNLTEPGDKIMVEIDLSRSLRLQTESSPQIREGIRLNWTRDY